MTGDGEVPSLALAGLRVLDLSQWLPGPYLTQMLGQLGADVAKIEPRSGDPGRADSGWVSGISNFNKRSIALDLKNEDDRSLLLELASRADIFVEGFRPGVVDRLGVGYEAVRAFNPGIVYCSISGFGQTGPYRDKPGHDLTYLAMTGALSAPPHWVPGAPQRSTAPVADLSASLFAAVAVLAALRERDRTGVGAFLDVGIADTTLALASPRSGSDFALKPEDKIGIFAQNDIYPTADGQFVAVSAVEEKFWSALRAQLQAFEPEIADPAFDAFADRHRNGDWLHAVLTKAFRQKSAEYWQHLFEQHDVPVDRIVTVAEAIASPQVAARGIVQFGGAERSMGFPVLCNGVPMGRPNAPPPGIGTGRDDILVDWGVALSAA